MHLSSLLRPTLRVLYDHQIFCLQQYGGISRYFYELANHVDGFAGWDAEIFAPFHVNGYLAAHEGVHPKGLSIPRSFGIGRLGAWGMDTCLAYLKLRPRRDVNILHETYYTMADYCPAAASRVITIHDMIYEKFPDQFPRRDKIRQMKAHAVARADHVICVSESTRRDLVTILGVAERKTSVVYHGYSCVVNGHIMPAALLKKPYLLFVGQRGGYKNFETLIQAYSHSLRLRKELSLVCFGGGPFSNAEKKLIKMHGLSAENVIPISGDDNVLAGLYASATSFVYPSLYEGFGIPLLEAMSLDCPVICSNSSAFPEVVGDAADLFDPRDVDFLQRAIERVVFSPDYRDSLIRRGRERVKQFSWDKCAQGTLQVYEQLLN